MLKFIFVEPPQGSLKQIFPTNINGEDSDSNVQYLKVTGGRWQLSEDPEDRKGKHCNIANSVTTILT